ncbi:transglutaminase TgpA family protein [Halochromatium sp.]
MSRKPASRRPRWSADRLPLPRLKIPFRGPAPADDDLNDREAGPPSPDAHRDRYRDLPADRWQLIVATLLLGLGAAPLLLALRLHVGLFVLSLLLISAAAIRWPRLQPNRWVLVALTLLGGLVVLDSYHSVVGQHAGSALLLVMIALKRLESRTRRDLRVLVIAFGFLLVIQFLFGKSPWLAVWMLLMLVGAVALLTDLSVAGRSQQRLADWRTAGRMALILTAQAAPLAFVLFLLFPRLDAPLWDLQLGDERAISGLKNWLEPGSISELIVSGEDAFRVRFDAPQDAAQDLPINAMYWRGPVLWCTNGQRWLPLPALAPAPRPTAAAASEAANRSDKTQPTDALPVRELLSEPISYTVLLEPTDQRWLFALELPTRLPERSQLTADFQLLAEKPVTDLRLYRASSVLDYRMSRLAPAHEQAALQLPPNVTERTQALVADWQRMSETPAQVVQQALAFFSQPPFRYTLLPPRLGDNPTDEFLFETQAGFCEHYASSFVLLMRLAGIPSRIVLGYLGGEYNPLSGDYLIRQSDAHAWAEIWLEGRGWTRVDPTAAIDPARVERELRFDSLGRTAPARFRVEESSVIGQLVRNARFLADAFDSGWRHWVLGFSSQDQFRLLDRLGLGAWREYGLALLMTIAGSAVMLGWAMALARKPRTHDPVQRCWQRFGRRLARIGLGPQHHEAPLHYRARVFKARPDLQPTVDPIVDSYIKLRYQALPTKTVQQALCRQVGRFRPRRRRGPGSSR